MIKDIIVCTVFGWILTAFLFFGLIGCGKVDKQSTDFSLDRTAELAVRPNATSLEGNVYYWNDRPSDSTEWIKYKRVAY